MLPKAIDAMLPDYAADLKHTLSAVITDSQLNPKQLWGCLLASAIASKNHRLVLIVEEASREHLSPQEITASKGAAALMNMNNIYFRFWYLADDKEYLQVPYGLSQEMLSAHGVDNNDFEFWALSVSAINGCSGCVKVHSRTLLKSGYSKAQIMACVRAAAVMHGIAATLAGEGVQ